MMRRVTMMVICAVLALSGCASVRGTAPAPSALPNAADLRVIPYTDFMVLTLHFKELGGDAAGKGSGSDMKSYMEFSTAEGCRAMRNLIFKQMPTADGFITACGPIPPVEIIKSVPLKP